MDTLPLRSRKKRAEAMVSRGRCRSVSEYKFCSVCKIRPVKGQRLSLLRGMTPN